VRAAEHVPRPAEVPDLTLTDYLTRFDLDVKSRLRPELDNHRALYLDARQDRGRRD
jgi:hypothetical protein